MDASDAVLVYPRMTAGDVSRHWQAEDVCIIARLAMSG
jgi:hypothetical protein